MASAWSTSWADAWGASRGASADAGPPAPPRPVVTAGGGGNTFGAHLHFLRRLPDHPTPAAPVPLARIEEDEALLLAVF